MNSLIKPANDSVYQLTSVRTRCTIFKMNDTNLTTAGESTSKQRFVFTRKSFFWTIAGICIIFGACLSGTGQAPFTSGRIEIDLEGQVRHLNYHLYPASGKRDISSGRLVLSSALLLHGTNSSKESYRFLGQSLARMGIRAIAMDFSDDVWSLPNGHLVQARSAVSRLLPEDDSEMVHRWGAVGHSDGGEPAFIVAGVCEGARAVFLIGTLVPDPALLQDHGAAAGRLPAIMGAVGLYDEIFYPGEVEASVESTRKAYRKAGFDLPEPGFIVSPLSDHFLETLDPVILAETVSFLTRSFPGTQRGEPPGASSLVRRAAIDIIGETLLYAGVILLVSLVLARPGATPGKRRLLLILVFILSILSGPVTGGLWPAVLFFGLIPFYLVSPVRSRDNRPSLTSILILMWAAAVMNLILASQAFWSALPASILRVPAFALWQPVVLLPKLVSVLKLYSPPPWETGLPHLFWMLVLLAVTELILPGKGASWLDKARMVILEEIRGPFLFLRPVPAGEGETASMPQPGVTGKQILILTVLAALAGCLWFYRYTQGVLGMDLLLSLARMAIHTAVGPSLVLLYIRITAYLRDKHTYYFSCSDSDDEV